MRKIAATYIFPGNEKPLKNGILICENDGTVFETIDSSGNLNEQAGLEFYNGILVPGFVNAYCKFQFSHLLQGLVTEKKEIYKSIKETNHQKSIVSTNVEEIFCKIDRKIWFNGIVAVGDISNELAIISVKTGSKIKYHTFTNAELLQNNLNSSILHITNLSEDTLKIIQSETQFFLIDNTFFERIKVLRNCCYLENNFFILCPLSNLLIDNKLPSVEFFRLKNISFCLGTGSLTSNYHISILSEMLVLQQNFPELTLEELIKWACFNGSQALKIDDWAGSFEKGKKPGVNLISGIDFKNMKLTINSKIKRLI